MKNILIIALESDGTIKNDLCNLINYPLTFKYIKCNNKISNIDVYKLLIKQIKSIDTSSYDEVVFGCTSATAVLGYNNLVKVCKPLITPLTSAVSYMKLLNVKNIFLFTPYVPIIAETLSKYFKSENFNIVGEHHLNEPDDLKLCKLTNVMDLVCDKLYNVDTIDCIFVSCTSLSILKNLSYYEKKLQIPIISSNTAIAASLKLCLDL